MRDGGQTAGSSRDERLDPFALPLRFSTSDAAADGRVRQVELTRERVVVRRSLAGMPMALNMPISAFAGIALKLKLGEGPATLAVILAHKDPALDLPLYASVENDAALVEWRNWAEVLGLPLLIDDASEGWREPPPRQVGYLQMGAVRPRRRRRGPLRNRRPSILLRRAPGKLSAVVPIHRGEREIIARN